MYLLVVTFSGWLMAENENYELTSSKLEIKLKSDDLPSFLKFYVTNPNKKQLKNCKSVLEGSSVFVHHLPTPLLTMHTKTTSETINP